MNMGTVARNILTDLIGEPIHPVHVQPKWTQDEAIAYECARDYISDMIGMCVEQIREEENKQSPDLEKLAHLKADHHRLHHERSALRVQDTEAIERVHCEYAPITGAWIRNSGRVGA
jgi:hypothetical protein